MGSSWWCGAEFSGGEWYSFMQNCFSNLPSPLSLQENFSGEVNVESGEMFCQFFFCTLSAIGYLRVEEEVGGKMKWRKF